MEPGCPFASAGLLTGRACETEWRNRSGLVGRSRNFYTQRKKQPGAAECAVTLRRAWRRGRAPRPQRWAGALTIWPPVQITDQMSRSYSPLTDNALPADNGQAIATLQGLAQQKSARPACAGDALARVSGKHRPQLHAGCRLSCCGRQCELHVRHAHSGLREIAGRMTGARIR